MQTSTVHMSPIQWASLPDIEDVPEIADADFACLDAIRRVLVEHGAVGRFGVHLLHRHFEVDPEEILVEYTDVDSRTLTSRVESRNTSPVGHRRIETMWSFAGEGATRVCDGQCVYNNGHARRHWRR